MPIDGPEGRLFIHSDLAAAEASWRTAWSAYPGAYAFQCYDWVAAWQATLGEPHGWRPAIVDLRDGAGRTVLLLPLGIGRQGGLKVLAFLGGPLADYQAPLADPAWAAGLSPARLAALWRWMLRHLPAADLVSLRRMPSALADGRPNPLTALADARHTENAHAALLPADFQAFCAARASRLFADTRRQLRRLQESGSVRVERDIPPGPLRDQVMAALAEQKGRRWRDTGNPDGFEDPGLMAFFQRLNDGPLQNMRAVVSALFLDDRPIATHWGLRSADRYCWLMPAYDAEWSKYSPGRLLMEDVIRQCIDERMPVFDLTVGDEAYKAQWADQHLELYALRAPGSWRGRLVLGLVEARERARDIPALRTAVQRFKALLKR